MKILSNLKVSGSAEISNIPSSATNNNKFLVSENGVIKYRTGSELLSDINGQQSISLTTNGLWGVATFNGSVLNIPNYSSAGQNATIRTSEVFIASASQTVFNLSNSLASAYFDVYVNGVKLDSTSYSNTNTSITLIDGTYANDIVEIVIYGVLSLSAIVNVPSQSGQSGKFLSTDGTSLIWSVNPLGTVTSVSVVSANGFSGTVATSTTTPAITISTSITGILKGNGTAISAAVSGTDYQSPITLTTTGSSGAATFTSNTLNIPNYTLAGLGGISLASLSASSPLSYSNTTGVFSIQVANTSQNGYLSSTDWNTFNGKQSTITLTTTGSSGAATFTSNTLNIPNYTLSGLGGVPSTRSITINGTAYDLSLDRVWSVGTVTSVSALTIGTTGTDITSTIATGTTTPVITLNIPTASSANRGALSSTDWYTFNNKQAQLNGIGFVKVSGTTVSYDNSTYLTTISGISAGGELSGTYPNPSLVTSAVTGKVLTGLNVTGGSISATDSILAAFGKLQNQVNSLAGSVIYQGTWNANTNSPALTSSVGTKGYYYIVSVAGTTSLNGITDWQIGDWVIFDGAAWQKVDNTDSVSSVNGFTGAVSLTTSNISEGTNLYYTDSRARLAITLTTTGSSGSATYNNTSGALNIPTYTLSGLGGFTNPMTTLGDIIYGAASGAATRLAGNTTTTKNVLLSTGSGTAATAPTWGTLSASDVGAQASSTNLTSLAGLTYASASFVKMTAAGTFTLDTNTYYLASNPSGYTNNTGTVTSVSVTTANGISGTVATSTTTPAITLTLGAITPTTVNGLTFTAAATGFTIAGGTTSKTLTVSNTLTLAGTDSSTLNIGSGGTLGSAAFTASSAYQASSTNLTSIAGLTYASASFVKMTAAGTFTLDTNTYYLASNPSGYTNNTGTVTSVSVTTANGISGTVATSTTTPAITLTLGAITPTTVNGLTLTAAATGFTIAGGTTSKTLTVSNTLTLAGTDSSTLNIGTGGTLGSAAFTASTAYQAPITLTTTGSSGSATFTSNTLNVPTYTLSGLGGQPSSTNLTSLSGLTYVSASFVKMTAAGTFSLDTNTYLTANQTITLSGDVSGSGTTAITTTIGANKVTNSMLSQVATATFKGRTTAGTGNVEDLTATQATALLNQFTSTLQGLVPASGGGTSNFLRADGTWAAPPGSGGGSGTVTTVSVVSANGFAGTVATASTTPAITLTTTITGLLKGNGTAISAAVASTDYVIPSDLSSYVPTSRTLNTLALSSNQTFATGTTGTDFNISSSGTTHTFNIPDASTTARGLVTTGSQTFNGAKAFNSSVAVYGTFAGGQNTGNIYIPFYTGYYFATETQIKLNNITTGMRVAFALPSSTSTPTANTNYSGVIIGSGTFQAATSPSVHPLVANLSIKAPIIDLNTTGVVTNATTLYIESAPVTGTNLYSIWVDDGTVRLDAALELQGIPNSSSGNILYYDSTTKRVSYSTAPSGTGTVTNVSVVSANGFAGTVATSTSTPAITLTTTVTGLLKGNGTAISAAVANTDYLAVASPAYTGVLSTGTLGFTPANHFAALSTSSALYNQLITQNTSNGAAASNDIVVNNNLSTDSTYYGDFGINSSNYTGSGSFNLANAVYLTSTSGDLVLGTTTSNPIHFVVNSGATDAAVIKTTGQLQLNGYTTTTSFSGTAAGYLAFDSSGNVITTAAPTGGGGYTVTNQTTTYNATATSGTLIIKCDTTGGAFTVNLPTAVGNTATIIIKKTAGTGAVTVDGSTTETIDGGLTATINKTYESITLISDNTNWQIV